MDRQLDLRRIAQVINRERPDLVGLQEVDRGVERTGRVNQIAELARLTRMEYAFAHNLDYQGGQYGVAILSRFPILAIDHRRYASRPGSERRGFIRVEVEVNRRRLSFVTTHLDYRDAEGRLNETEQLLRALESVAHPLIVTGDFNDEPTDLSYQRMLTRFGDAWTANGASAAGFTFPADRPIKRIDYIFLAERDGWRTRRSWITPTLASDHLPLVADIELRSDLRRN